MGVYLSIIVEVRVEAHCVVASGFQVDVGGRVGVVLGEVDIKLKRSIGIGRVGGSCDQDLKKEPLASSCSYKQIHLLKGNKMESKHKLSYTYSVDAVESTE